MDQIADMVHDAELRDAKFGRERADARKLLVTRGIRGLADGLVSIALASYLTGLGFSPFQVGAIVTGTLLGSAVVTLAVGLLGYRLSRRRVLLGAAALMVLTGLGFAGFTAFWPLLVVGAAGTLNPSSGDVSVFLPTEQAALAHTVSGPARTMVFAWYNLVGSLAGAVGALIALTILAGAPAWAGPPFLTDDPEPVDLGHWEIYAASQWSATRQVVEGTCPHVEVNYGALPELQLHAIVPAALASVRGEPVRYGVGDIELGAKFRFIDEGERRPQVGTFPLVLLPTGSAERRLGSGTTQLLLPIWVQKSFGRWTTYGGGGLHLASGERDGVAGWLVQRELAKSLIVGTETFLTLPLNHGALEVRINIGLVVNFSGLQHLLLSAGPAFGGGDRAQAYVAYQLTI